MMPVTRLRAGTTFRLEGKLYQVIEYKHTKLGRGQATIRVRVRNLESGEVVEKTLTSGAKVESVETETKPLQYLYQDGENFYFMDPRSFEQFVLPTKILAKKTRFLKEGKEVKVLFLSSTTSGEKKPLSVELPKSMIFKVIKAAPGVKGNTVSGASKPATLENGLVVQVPLFIKKGDKIKIDTRTGKYVERAR